MFNWLWDYFWFWTVGWWVVAIIVVPPLILLSYISDWLWKNHTPTRQWIARNLGI